MNHKAEKWIKRNEYAEKNAEIVIIRSSYDDGC